MSSVRIQHHPILSRLREEQVPIQKILLDDGDSLSAAIRGAGIAPEAVIRAELYEDDAGILLVVLPAHQKVDLERLNVQLKRSLKLAASERAAQLFPGCALVPTFGGFYGVPTVVERAVVERSDIYFGLGTGRQLFKIDSREFLRLHPLAKFGKVTEVERQRPADVSSSSNAAPRLKIPPELQRFYDGGKLRREESILDRLERVEDLPVLPDMARQLLLLRNKPRANVADLTKVIEIDPSLTAQVMRYSRSAFFGYQGRLDSVHDAIARVLGYESVLNMALGLAAGRTFRIPKQGPLGLRALWRHSIYSATLAQIISTTMEEDQRPRSGLAYLGGLLHNFGFFLVGHLYTDEYKLLTGLVAANPELPLAALERHVLGTSHTEIGARLLEYWGMPPEIVTATREHHSRNYHGPYSAYVQLLHFADDLLEKLPTSPEIEVPEFEIESELEITSERAHTIARRVHASYDQLDDMVRRMAA